MSYFFSNIPNIVTIIRIILTPIFNDWESLDKLLKEINFETSGWDAKVSIVIINDSSTQKKLPINYKFENTINNLNEANILKSNKKFNVNFDNIVFYNYCLFP